MEKILQLPIWNEKEVVITAGPHDCLLIFTQSGWEEFLLKLSTLESKPKKVLFRFFTSHSQVLEVRNNRINIPEELLEWIVKDEANSDWVDKEKFLFAIEAPGANDIFHDQCSYVIRKSL